MKNQLLLYFLFISVVSFSQQRQNILSGTILFQNEVITDVHIINKNANQGSASNDLGTFEITVSINDTLIVSHINLQKKEIIITQEIFKSKSIIIHLEEKVNELNEITFERSTGIFYVDKQYLKPPTVNAKTLHLPYANSGTKKDESIVSLQSGAAINLENLIGAVNGSNRRKKILKKLTYEDKMLEKIRKHYTDDFFITDLNIKQDDINVFLNYCFKKNVINIFKKDDKIKVTAILMRESKTFPQKNKTEITLRQKK
ncbi:MAG: carboxypeptidase-like regulatory domain-containing protein [Polaribacter sp.]